MSEYQFITNILIYSIVPTFVSLFITERIKGIVKNSFDKKLEEVKKEHLKEISQFQTELNHLKARENFKFTKLHEKRLEILEETYSYIIKTIRLLHIYVSPIKSSNNLELNYNEDKIFDDNYIQKIANQFKELYDEFNLYYNKNTIYFDEDTEKILYDYFMSSADVFLISNSSNVLLKMNIKEEIEHKETINSTFEALNKKVLPLKKQIEIKFRELLGE